ncbi:Mtc5p [Sugiyamaella lignohabitans]|uniref:Mtc5p n=1 Tax=Sugiyamaella lignohabitans TaxID=796027 RepID=A0A167F640_9ASCO|nr:Mtc5p [Sugiyamaella lignohabitans]ANB14882.1 Mtc5p [Sugiyamaella lignohabitans]
MLTSRSGLFVIDLDDPFSPPRWLHHRTSWEVADVQWCPHAFRPYSVISTSNQKALVWNLAMSSDCAVEHVLHGHKRAITDINFHSAEPDIIATCSVDSRVNVWDLRDPSKPTTTFADWNVGASQVKWNRLNPFVLASCHDRNVYLWDTRKGSIPLHTIRAHDSKVNSIDFSRTCESKILTCSNDHTVKGWDYKLNDEQPDITIKTDFPIWRARHTPFGSGCVIMPLRGGNNSVFLTNLQDMAGEHYLDSSFEFKGHTEPVKEFVWRSRGGEGDIDDREFQLVTWSKDHDLRLWPVEDRTLESANFKRGAKLTMRITRKGARYETYHNEPNVRSLRTYNKGLNTTGGLPATRTPFGLSPSSAGKRGSEFGGRQHGSHHHHQHHHRHHHHHHHNAHNRRTGAPVKDTRTGFMTRATKTNFYNHNINNNSHLDWIAGVRMGRAAFDPPFDTSIRSDYFLGGDSSNPGNLGEEVSIVGHKFPKVRFEKISVSTGECIITLKAPWGDTESDLVFVRIHVLFPVDYPFSPPKFRVEEDDSFGEGKYELIKEEVAKIAELLASHGKYCLELCLRFLLGEKVSLEELERQEIEKHIEDDTGEVGIAGRFSFGEDGEELPDLTNEFIGSSSDDDLDDEDIATHRLIIHEKSPEADDLTYSDRDGGVEGGLKVTQQISETSKVLFDSTPVPKGCGAVWSKSGELVCFFIGKSAMKSTVSRQLSTRFPEKGLSQMLSFRDDSGDSDSSDSFESDSDLLDNDGVLDQHYYGLLATGKLRNTLRFRQASSKIDSSAPVSNSGGSQRGIPEKKMNVVRILDFKHLIPSRQDMAAEYKVLGAPPGVLAKWNRQVAEKYGCHQIAYCWSLIELIIGANLEVYKHAHTLSKAGNVSTSLMNLLPPSYVADPKKSQIALPSAATSLATATKLSTDINFDWGQHPFRRRWLVEELFRYFELEQNTQMLAHMSCILSGSSTIDDHNMVSSDSAASGLVMPHAIKSPFAHDLLWREGGPGSATAGGSGSGYFSPIFFSNYPNSSHVGGHSPTSVSSLVSASPEKHIGGFRNFVSIPSTPHYRSHVQSRDMSSTSSKQMVLPNHYNTNSGYATANNSVKSVPGKLARFDSDNDLHLGLMFNRSGINTQLPSRNSVVGSETSKPEPASTPSYLPSVRVEILNEEFLDFTEQFPRPFPDQFLTAGNKPPAVLLPAPSQPPQLLDPNKTEKFIAYRDQYATMLYSWGLQVERLEILKFNYTLPGGLQAVRRPSIFDKFHCAYIQFRTMRQLEDFELVNTTDMSLNRSYARTCHYCKLMIKTRFFQCINCEHIQHADCGVEWFVSNGEKECPSGCGCACLDYL